MDEKEYEILLQSMTTISRLLAFSITRNMELQKDKILTLNRLGLSNNEIAKILGISGGSVRGTISQSKD